jgi:hypothetical protein
MKTTEMLGPGALSERRLSDLVDQMDPAIGEASSVMGAMATELIRRSLRGGVLQIGRELTAYVSQQVEEQIVEQRPLIEKTAAVTATEVARGEVDAVRQAASEQGQQLSARIDDASRHAQEQSDAVARNLTGRLEETSRETRREFEAATTSLARTLESEVAAVESRTLDGARKEFTAQIEAYKERARQASIKFKERLDKLDATAVQLTDHQRALKAELLDAWRTERNRLRQDIDELRRLHETFAQRLDVLERPRGIRRLFSWLFGRKPKAPPSEAAVEVAREGEPS